VNRAQILPATWTVLAAATGLLGIMGLASCVHTSPQAVQPVAQQRVIPQQAIAGRPPGPEPKPSIIIDPSLTPGPVPSGSWPSYDEDALVAGSSITAAALSRSSSNPKQGTLTYECVRRLPTADPLWVRIVSSCDINLPSALPADFPDNQTIRNMRPITSAYWGASCYFSQSKPDPNEPQTTAFCSIGREPCPMGSAKWQAIEACLLRNLANAQLGSNPQGQSQRLILQAMLAQLRNHPPEATIRSSHRQVR